MSSLYTGGDSGGGGGSIAAKNGSTQSAEASEKQHVPSVFNMRAPRWRPRLHPGSRALGAPDVYVRQADDPPLPEDDLSEGNVKNGLSTRPAVGNETFSAHDMIYDRLKGKAVVQQLGALFDEVVQRREQLASLRCGPTASQYRQPQRVTLNEVKLAAYVKELADPSVPLRKLARSVPHGYRGERMLDMLWNGGSLAPVIAAVKTQQQTNSNAATSGNNSNNNNNNNNVNVNSSSSNNNNNSTSNSISNSNGINNNNSSSTSSAHTHAADGGLQRGAGVPNSVTIDRAVWFVRVVGASEITSSRLRQGKSGAYTAEWTGVLMGWLRRQIVELNIVHHHHHGGAATTSSVASPIPSSPHLSKMVNVKQSPSSHLYTASTPQRSEDPYALILEDDFRNRWMSKWGYSLSLLRALIYEGLIDEHVAARTALDMLRTANVAQIFIVLALVEEFLDVIVGSATLLHFAISVFSSKHFDVKQSGQQGKLHSALLSELERSILYCLSCGLHKDASVSPSCWKRVSSILRSRNESIGHTDVAMLHEADERNRQLFNGFADVLTRGLSFSSAKSMQLRNIRDLDNYIEQPDISSLFEALFQADTLKAGLIPSETLRQILLWSTTEERCGAFRPFVGAALIECYSRRQPGRTLRESPKGRRKAVLLLQRVDIDALITAWITDVDNEQRSAEHHRAGSERNNALRAVSHSSLVVLMGELCRRGCFSFQKYLQRLTARGLTATSARTNSKGVDGDQSNSHDSKTAHADSLHIQILRHIPLPAISPALSHQRRIAIYGHRNKESWEEATERRAKREVHQALPWLWNVNDAAEDSFKEENAAHQDLNVDLTRFWSSSRYTRSRIIDDDILPALWKYALHATLSVSHLAQLANIFTRAEEFDALWKILVFVDARSQEDEESQSKLRKGYQVCIDTLLLEHRLVWMALGLKLPLRMPNSDSSLTPKARQDELPAKADIAEAIETSLKQWRSGQTAEKHLPRQAVAVDTALQVLLKYCNDEDEQSATLSASDWARALIRQGRLDGSMFSVAFLDALVHSHRSEDLSGGLTSLTLALLSNETISCDNFIGSFVVPSLSNLGAQTDEGRLNNILTLLESIFTAECGTGLAYVKAAYFSNAESQTTLRDLLQLCSLISSQEDSLKEVSSSSAIRCSSLRTTICSQDIIRACVQRKLHDCVQYLYKNASQRSFHAIMRELMPSRWPWTSDAHLMSVAQSVFDRVDAIRWDQTLCELCLVVNLLQQKAQTNGPQSNGNGNGHSNEREMNALASLVQSRLLNDEESQVSEDALRMLLFDNDENGAFTNALLEEYVKSLNIELAATFADEQRVRKTLLSVLRLFRTLPEASDLVVTSSAIHCLRLVTEWFESKASALSSSPFGETVDNNVAQTMTRKAQDDIIEGSLLLHLSVICMLLKLNSLLNNTSAKALAPRLFCAILHIALTMSRRPGMSDTQLNPVLDVSTYFLQQAPYEVQLAMQARVLEQIGESLRICPMLGVARRLARLANMDNSVSKQSQMLVEAQSNASALYDGNFALVMIKPWELHPNLDANGVGGNAQQMNENAASSTEMGNMTNNGPISLHHFGAYRMMDRLPDLALLSSNSKYAPATPSGGLTEAEVDHHAPKGLTSEESYGLHLAGESIYARDAQRGLLALRHSSDGRLDARHLVSALLPRKAPTPPPITIPTTSKASHSAAATPLASSSTIDAAKTTAATTKSKRENARQTKTASEASTTAAAAGKTSATAKAGGVKDETSQNNGGKKRKSGGTAANATLASDAKAPHANAGRKRARKT